jgi:hypothetical protein
MAIRTTQVRNFFGAVFAILLIVVLAAVLLAMFGIRVPVLSDLTDLIGIQPGA